LLPVSYATVTNGHQVVFVSKKTQYWVAFGFSDNLMAAAEKFAHRRAKLSLDDNFHGR
jgi:hypothetical protein